MCAQEGGISDTVNYDGDRGSSLANTAGFGNSYASRRAAVEAIL
jgi:hypothetical protein